MSRDIDILERHYSSFIYSDDTKEFFEGLRYYMDLIQEDERYNKILNDLLEQGKPLYAELKKLEIAAEKKLGEIHKELLEYITKNNLTDEVKGCLTEYEGYVRSKSLTGQYEELFDIVSYFYKKPEHTEFMTRYVVFSPHKVYISYYLYPAEYKSYWECLQELKAKYQGDLWGQMSEVIRHIEVVRKGREKKKQLLKSALDDNNFEAKREYALSHVFLLGEWQQIETGKQDHISFFKINDYRPAVKNFENYMIRKLTELEKHEKFTETLDGFQKEIDITDKIVNGIKQQMTIAAQRGQLQTAQTKPENSVAAVIPTKTIDKKKTEKIVLHLSKRGELYKEAINKFCYPIEEDSDRLKIVRYFVNKEVYDYYPTQQIASDLEFTTEDLMKKIGKLNNIAIGKLKVKSKVLEGRKGSGYKINSIYKIVADK